MRLIFNLPTDEPSDSSSTEIVGLHTLEKSLEDTPEASEGATTDGKSSYSTCALCQCTFLQTWRMSSVPLEMTVQSLVPSRRMCRGREDILSPASLERRSSPKYSLQLRCLLLIQKNPDVRETSFYIVREPRSALHRFVVD